MVQREKLLGDRTGRTAVSAMAGVNAPVGLAASAAAVAGSGARGTPASVRFDSVSPTIHAAKAAARCNHGAEVRAARWKNDHPWVRSFEWVRATLGCPAAVWPTEAVSTRAIPAAAASAMSAAHWADRNEQGESGTANWY